MAKTNLVNLAKNKKKPIAKKSEKEVVVIEEKPITPAEERDLKAKQKVKELLQDVPMTLEKKDDLLEVEIEPQKEGNEWLEEQVTLLGDQSENLRNELAQTKEDYKKIFEENQRLKNNIGIPTPNNGVVMNDEVTKANVLRIFNEIQDNYLAMGRNFIIVPPAFLNRLVMFFPFLESHKKY